MFFTQGITSSCVVLFSCVKEEELQKTSEKIKNLETMRAHQQTPTDHTDSAKSPDSRAPDSRSGDWKSHDAMSDDTKPDISHHASRSGDPRSHDVSQQELHLASALNVLTREVSRQIIFGQKKKL